MEQLSELASENIRSPHNVELLQDLTAPESMQQREVWLRSTIDIAGEGSFGHIARLLYQKDRNNIAATEAFSRGDYEQDRNLTDKGNKLREMASKTFGETKVREFTRTVSALEALSKNRMEFWGDEGQQLFDRLAGESPAVDDGIDREHLAPPAELPEPSTRDYTDYLGKKIFIKHDTLSRNKKENAPDVVIKIEPGSAVEVPTSSVVSAGSFDSWLGRGPEGQGDKSYDKSNGQHVIGRSIQAIMDYAERDTPLPTVSEMTGYVQPNGKVIFAAVNDNHRTAAAIARGQQHIPVSGSIMFRQLEKNLIQ